MTYAYNELYLYDARLSLGEMLDYAVYDCQYEPDHFFSWFINCGIAEKFEHGNPKYIGGMSGVELASKVIFLTSGSYTDTVVSSKSSLSPAYWSGWMMAYYQWVRRLRFSDMVENGLSLSTILSLYTLHEADDSKFVLAADKIMQRSKAAKATHLKQIRKARGFTQQELALQSGVSLRMIQLYEQRQNDIGKAQTKMVWNLSRSLGCEIEDLLE